jgi:hypothetical protein|tara:strand:+ start:1070 stop:1222 length:153 start_codon:yes stop_codon:yes gene_type:complete
MDKSSKQKSVEKLQSFTWLNAANPTEVHSGRQIKMIGRGKPPLVIAKALV